MPLFHDTMCLQVLSMIRADIMSGTLAAGEKLNEQLLANRYQISRTPLREAIRQLGAEGLVDVIPNKGARVTPVTPHDIHDFFEARSLLESYVLVSAMDHMTEESFLDLKNLIIQLKYNHLQKNYADNYNLILELHRALLKHCPNKLLRDALWNTVQRFASFRYKLVRVERTHQMYTQFEKLVEGFETKDAKLITETHKAILDTYKSIIFEDIQKTHPELFKDRTLCHRTTLT